MGAKRERREVGELRRVGPREEWGREKKGVEKGKGTHPEAGQEGEEGGLSGGGGRGWPGGGRAGSCQPQLPASGELSHPRPAPSSSRGMSRAGLGSSVFITPSPPARHFLPESSSILPCAWADSAPPALPPGWPLLPPGCVPDLPTGTPPSSTLGALLPPTFFLPCPLSSGRFSGYVPWRWGRCLGESARLRAQPWCYQPLQESS